jgi:hypothetical protein
MQPMTQVPQVPMGHRIMDCLAPMAAPMRPPVLPFKALSDLSNRLFLGRPAPTPTTFYFTQKDLDFALYGYSSVSGSAGKTAHALSGLKIGEISHGKSIIYYRLYHKMMHVLCVTLTGTLL